ncbi:unnamed protein product [Rhizoctonia solani]|uniref:NAD(P)-binding protein n=1 Tax=Rhizoctonia solani TaxID=456999 RepID=A0A8H3BGV4_9AGAM|nr:unnamed protein product [Rhizoctonia solani]
MGHTWLCRRVRNAGGRWAATNFTAHFSRCDYIPFDQTLVIPAITPGEHASRRALDFLKCPIESTGTPPSSPHSAIMGVAYSLFIETFPGTPRWSVDEVPDLSGQVVIVTGGNSGIGLELCKVLLNRGAKVYMTARDREKAEKAIEDLRTETSGKSPIFLELDLADLGSVRRAVEEYKSKEQELHVLYNNAGVMMSPPELKTTNGYDLQFGTNVLGPYLFTTLLLPTLIHTAQTSPLAGGTARVVNASSGVHWAAPRGGVNYASLVPNNKEADEIRHRMGPTSLYAQSKWAVIAFSNELARRYGPQGIMSASLHPGAIANKYNVVLPGIGGWITRLMLRPTSWGPLTHLYAGTTPDARGISGKYLIPWGRVGAARSSAFDHNRGQQVWEWLEEQAKLH